MIKVNKFFVRFCKSLLFIRDSPIGKQKNKKHNTVKKQLFLALDLLNVGES